VDIPDAWRGKVGTLRFELDNSSQDIYLDNIFFKSQHLLLGNPTEARNPNNAESIKNNYLSEKPQFTVSYSKDDNIPNWSAWQLNNSWTGTEKRPSDYFAGDPAITSLGWIGVDNPDYAGEYSDGTPKANLPQINPDDNLPYKLAPGHLAPVDQRKRSLKDIWATFLTTNIVPQFDKLNSPVWANLEKFEKTLATRANNQRELYIYSGSVGTKANKPSINITDRPDSPYDIRVPASLWRVVVVMDTPGLGISEINSSNTHAFALLAANELPEAGQPPDKFKPWYTNGNIILTSISDLEGYLNSDPTNQSRGITYNFLSNLPTNIRTEIKSQPFPILPPNQTPGDVFLLADSDASNSVVSDTAINPSSIPIDILFKQSIFDVSTKQTSIGQVTFNDFSRSQGSSSQISISQISTPECSPTKDSTSQISTTEIGSIQTNLVQTSFTQIGSTQIVPFQIGLGQLLPAEINSTQIGIDYLINPNLITSKVSDSTGVESQNFFILNSWLLGHNPNLQNTTVPTWTEFLQSPTPFNLKIEVTDLPTGQLAEATVTGYDTFGRPNAGTLTLDTNGNSLGWFIDTTPEENSEFTTQLADTAYKATADSAAYGKYDLLTTILHELGHLNGIIRGNTAFDTHVQNINGIPTFIDGGITATLTPDGSHFDSTLYPYDLMNTSLKPGVRKLPSALNLAMIDAINSGVGGGVSGVGTVNPAHLTAGALIGITNGDFTTPSTWNTAGATNIINGTATLTEQSQKLSELTQAFIIPTGAKTLQFTILNNNLIPGDTTKTANDAFEVALLDTNTFKPLAGTSIGLNHTDSLLNIQANGTIHKSDKVTITALGNNSSIVTIDLTQVTPTTQATLYFNLLGFGARTSTVTIDDVKLFTDTQPIPVTKNDTLITNQSTPLTFTTTQLTTNDTNVTQIQILTQPTHGTLTQTPDGKLTYQPVPTYVGNDSFTYLGYGSDGQISNLATVNLTVNNLPPTIQNVTIPTTINEGQTIQLSALAKDGGSSDNLTYTWNLGDGSNPVTGSNIAHTYTDNGNYEVTLTVTDKDGGSTNQTTTVKVDNLAPIVNLTTPTTTLNQGESLNLGVTYSDPGIKDTHTITWNFGDGTTPITGVTNPNHTFIKAGTNNVTVTVTDNDGASTTKTLQIAVANLPPTINTLDIPTNINEGSTVQLTATATDPGNDTLIYNWYINGATTPIVGQTIDYQFVDNGVYPVRLNVIDSNGAIATKSVDVTISNVAPVILSIVQPNQINEGQPVQFTATATDSGINDTLTYSWNFGDNTDPVNGRDATHTFIDNGDYNVTLTVTDKDGAATTQTVLVKVDNVAHLS
jgi:DNA/RNA endonuclease G (NUC1)/PKD repeat protein